VDFINNNILEIIMVYTERVKDVLEYVGKNPINIKSEAMFYCPTSELDSKRLPDVVEGLESEDVLLERKSEGNRINIAPLNKAQEHMAEVTAAMLYFACGGMDESHNIVLPYSWPKPTTLSGEPIKGSPAIKESEYCHSLLHRKEGDLIGELGSLGFSNCKFWFGKTGFHPLYSVVKGEALKTAKTEHKIVNEFLGHLSENDWNPDVFTDLCASALKTKNQDLELYDFCSDLSGKEWKILLEYCNETTNPVNQV